MFRNIGYADFVQYGDNSPLVYGFSVYVFFALLSITKKQEAYQVTLSCIF